MVPQGGAAKGQNDHVELLAGGMLDYYVPKSGSGSVNLDSATKEFLDALRKADTNLHPAQSDQAKVGGQPALLTRMTTKTSQKEDQVVYLYSVARDAGLWCLILAAPASQLGTFDPIFKQIAASVQFPN